MSDSARTWSLRLLALGIAIGVWFSVSFEDREALTERLVEASVSYNRPRGFVILDPVPTVNVRLRGSSKLVRQLNPYQVDVQVELAQTEPGTVNVNLGPENVLMPEGLEVVSLEPNTIRVELEREMTQRLPVVPHLVGEPAAGAVADEPEVFPNQVLVTGPESLLAKIQSLSTRPVNLNGHALTFEETVAVVPPDPLIQVVQPSKVSVRVPIRQPEPADSAGEARKP
jgi:YbbR domain-containing protein